MRNLLLAVLIGATIPSALVADDTTEGACQMTFEQVPAGGPDNGQATLRVTYHNAECGPGPAYYQFVGVQGAYIVFHQHDMFTIDFYAPNGTHRIVARSDQGGGQAELYVTFPQ